VLFAPLVLLFTLQIHLSSLLVGADFCFTSCTSQISYSNTPISLSIIFGHVVVSILCIPTNYSCTPFFYFPLLSFLNNFILLFIYFLFFEKKQNKIFENYKKLQKNRKKIKKIKMFSFTSLCMSDRSHRMTLIF